MAKAIDACRFEQMSVRQAAHYFSVPRTTLADKVAGKHLGSNGRPSKLDLATMMRPMIATTPEIVELFFGTYQSAYAGYMVHLARSLNVPVRDLNQSDVSKGIFVIDETSISNGASPKDDSQTLGDVIPGKTNENATLLEVYCADGSMPFHVLSTTRSLTPTEMAHLSSIDVRSQLLFMSTKPDILTPKAIPKCWSGLGF